MEEQLYFRSLENREFTFVVEGTHYILETDIPIKEEEYNELIELRSQGKQYRLKEESPGIGLFDCIEEYIPETVVNTEPTMEDRIKALEMALLEVL